jgi:choline dehydrogenase
VIGTLTRQFIPAGFIKIHNDPRYNWSFATEPEPNLNGRSIPIPAGKTLGGSSSINETEALATHILLDVWK